MKINLCDQLHMRRNRLRRDSLDIVLVTPQRDEVTGEWRKLHNEELNDLYCSPNIVRVIRSRIMGWASHVARMWVRRVAYRVLVGKPGGKRPLGRPRCRWEDNGKVDLQEVGCGAWTGLIWPRIGHL
jgi:hypothetical protein